MAEFPVGLNMAIVDFYAPFGYDLKRTWSGIFFLSSSLYM